MLNKNSMLTGIFIALIFPGVALATEFILNTNAYIISKPAVPYFIARALNLFILRYCLKKDADQTGKGVMLATFIVMLIVLFKLHPLR